MIKKTSSRVYRQEEERHEQREKTGKSPVTGRRGAYFQITM